MCSVCFATCGRGFVALSVGSGCSGGKQHSVRDACRLGNEPCLITVTLTRDFAPELMLVSGRLAKTLNLKAGTRGHILRKLWMYAKEHSKVIDDDPACVIADDELFELLGDRRLDMSTLSRKMNAFLATPVPVQLHHKLVLDGPSPCTALVVDMEVTWSLKPNMLQLPAFLERFDARTLLDEQDRRINGAHLAVCILGGLSATGHHPLAGARAPASMCVVATMIWIDFPLKSADEMQSAWQISKQVTRDIKC